MECYIGCKIIKAEVMDEYTYLEEHKGLGKEIKKKANRDGYVVQYPDGYVSWSPKEVFENAYRRIVLSELNLLQG